MCITEVNKCDISYHISYVISMPSFLKVVENLIHPLKSAKIGQNMNKTITLLLYFNTSIKVAYCISFYSNGVLYTTLDYIIHLHHIMLYISMLYYGVYIP